MKRFMFLGRLTVCARPGSQGTIHRPQNPWGPISRYFRTGASVRTKGTEDDVAQSAFYKPVRVVRVREGKHGPGLILLALIPITAFVLGTWQVQRLGWKTDLIAKLEDRILRDPLPLPPRIDHSAIPDFDFRRVYATGRFRHDQEMLVGPRMRDGHPGYLVITPLERASDGEGSTLLVNRGWIHKNKARQANRPDSLPHGDVTVEGLLRQPWKKNMFTPDNKPDTGEFYFPDVNQMAALTGSQPVWIEATFGMMLWLSRILSSICPVVLLLLPRSMKRHDLTQSHDSKDPC
jgi:surfeit locus 1 family protein